MCFHIRVNCWVRIVRPQPLEEQPRWLTGVAGAGQVSIVAQVRIAAQVGSRAVCLAHKASSTVETPWDGENRNDVHIGRNSPFLNKLRGPEATTDHKAPEGSLHESASGRLSRDRALVTPPRADAWRHVCP